MKNKILFLVVGLFLLMPSKANAFNYNTNYLVSYHNYGVTEEEQQLNLEETKETEEKRNIIEELIYRFTEKEEKDAIDYLLLGILITLMVVVIVLLNKKTYVVKREISVFEEDDEENKNLEKESKDLEK